MTPSADEIVRVASGNLIQVELYQSALRDAGIISHVAGDELSAGLGSTLVNSVQLYVRHADEPEAVRILTQLEADRGHLLPDDARQA